MCLINIHKLCLYYFILFGYKSSVTNGNCREEDDAIPICTAAKRSGKIIYIDTSAVPTNMLKDIYAVVMLAYPQI